MQTNDGWKLQICTDLALEAAEILYAGQGTDTGEIDGIITDTDKYRIDGSEIKITTVRVVNENGAKSIGKPVGTYVTLETEAVKENNTQASEKIIELLAARFVEFVEIGESESVLIVGLGNWNVTPDALGPKAVSKVLVTRHLLANIPESIVDAVRPVSAIAPGVMGITGIETLDVIKGIINETKPSLVIAIDALAARHSGRINATIQITDTGINPGAGVGNPRASLSEETLGVPVVAIGVPTVVDAATLVNDTMDRMLGAMIEELPEGSQFYSMLNNLESEEKLGLIRGALDPYTGNMFVTPKEVDSVIERLSNIIANMLNIALHPGIGSSDINRYIY